MKTRFISIVLMITLVTALFTACGSRVEYHNIAAQNNVYSMGTQSVVIKSSSLNSDEPTARFRQSISPSDIELGEALEGKTVTVENCNMANLSICIGADVTTFGKEITVKLTADGGAVFQ